MRNHCPFVGRRVPGTDICFDDMMWLGCFSSPQLDELLQASDTSWDSQNLFVRGLVVRALGESARKPRVRQADRCRTGKEDRQIIESVHCRYDTMMVFPLMFLRRTITTGVLTWIWLSPRTVLSWEPFPSAQTGKLMHQLLEQMRPECGVAHSLVNSDVVLGVMTHSPHKCPSEVYNM